MEYPGVKYSLHIYRWVWRCTESQIEMGTLGVSEHHFLKEEDVLEYINKMPIKLQRLVLNLSWPPKDYDIDICQGEESLRILKYWIQTDILKQLNRLFLVNNKLFSDSNMQLIRRNNDNGIIIPGGKKGDIIVNVD